MQKFATSISHLITELERIDLLIRAQVDRARQEQLVSEEFQGLVISEEEVDSLLDRAVGLPRWALSDGALPQAEFLSAYERMSSDIEKLKSASKRNGVELRFDRLAEEFELDRFERDAILVSLAPELDLRYERLYAYLQDDVTKKRPSVDLVLNLLCSSLGDKLSARARFAPTASLLKNSLIQLHDEPEYGQPPLLRKFIKVEPRVVEFLLGSNDLDPQLSPYTDYVMPSIQFSDLAMRDKFKRRLQLLAQKAQNESPAIFYFQGPYGVGKRATAEAICHELGVALLVVDGERLLSSDDPEFGTALGLVMREARLRGAILYWKGIDTLLTDEKRAWREELLLEIASQRGIGILAGNTIWEPADALHGLPLLRIEFPDPTYAERVELWSKSLNGHHDDELELQALAGKFRFSGGQIRDAASTAGNLARRRDPENGHITVDDIYTACRLQSNRKLTTLAQRIDPQYRWDDIVLPADRLGQLREICNTARHRALVLENWGFDQKLSLGKGLSVLFAGTSGTGKTMAAEIIANELGLDLYKIDLSTVVSKFVGETEKNLARIFAEAETSNAILFFDEADALFGKRSEIKDSHDRYANIEVSYLLQKMEEYEGITILATNLRKNMDEAFVRRMVSMVFFPFPEEEYRRRIWEGIWPPETPRDGDLDLAFMARQFKMAGGNIKNIALAAAFLAAEDGQVVEVEHLIWATRRELQKMGKVIVESDFGPYYGLIEKRQSAVNS